jgi:hypothetical protein
MWVDVSCITLTAGARVVVLAWSVSVSGAETGLGLLVCMSLHVACLNHSTIHASMHFAAT